nr:transposase family protein [Tepidibacillus decaturensis]
MNILNLSQLKVLNVFEDKNNYQILAESASPPSFCPHCGCVANLYKHDNRKQLYMDLPMHGKRVGIVVSRQRYKCRECNKTFWERLDNVMDEKRASTKRLVEYIEKQSLSHTLVSIAEEIGIDEKTVRNIF